MLTPGPESLKGDPVCPPETATPGCVPGVAVFSIAVFSWQKKH